MAVNTKQKRFAAPGVGRPFMRANYPTLSKDSGWRMSAGVTYPVATLSIPGAWTEQSNSTDVWTVQTNTVSVWT
jgi:hypothetical protein